MSAAASAGPRPRLILERGGAWVHVEGESARALVALGDLTPVPGAPAAVCGLTQIDGAVVPVIDAVGGGGAIGAGAALLLVEAGGVRAALVGDHAVAPADEAVAGGSRAVDLAALFASVRAAIDGDPARAGGAPSQVAAMAAAAPVPVGPVASGPVRARGHSALSSEEVHVLRNFFLEEAAAHLDAMDAALRRLALDGGDAEARAALARELHTFKGSAGAVALQELSTLAHRIEDRVLARDARPLLEAELVAISAGVEHLRIQTMRASGAPDEAGADPAQASGPTASSLPPDEPARIRVEVERVDALMETVSGLVIDRSRLMRHIHDLEQATRRLLDLRGALDEARREPARLDDAAAALGGAIERIEAVTAALVGDGDGLRRTTQEMRDGLHRIRTMEAGELFERVAAPARELARRSGREVDVRVTGARTAIDKSVAERLGDALLHLVRNAVAHGVEPVEERVLLGKPRAGRIELSARQRGAEVLIAVADDGGGVDVEGVRRALVRSGRVAAAAAARLDEQAVVGAIFEPGVSTREGADDLAGRGVGLDAVKEALARLGGTIACSSVRGRGARFTVRMPLPTAVERALLFKVAGQVYAVPAACVVEGGAAEAERCPAPGGEALVRRGEVLPVLDLRATLGREPVTGADAHARTVVLGADGAGLAVRCDKLIGERDIVIMPLGPLLDALPLYAGATISGAGKVQLLLDVHALAARARAAADPAPRVLCADDSKSAREALARVLRAAGYHVDTAVDGEAALAALRRARYDLLVTDLDMPRMGGHALLARVRRDPTLAAIPVIVVSSRDAAEHARARAAGAAACLPKPAAPAAVLRAVAAALAAGVN